MLLEPGRQPQQDVHILFDGGADPGPLDLHCHRGARAGFAPQPGLVHLGDRRGRGRFRLQLREDLPGRRPERPAYQFLHLLPRCRFGLILEPGELVGELLGEQVTASGQQLAELDEGNPALFQRTPKRHRDRRPPLSRLPAAQRPPLQVGAQPVPHQDPADLRVAPRARERAPCPQDELHRLRPGPGRHQRLRRHDEDHRDDQRDAQRDAEEHGQMPGLGRPQRLAHD